MYLYRPFYFSKIIRKTDEMYKKVLSHIESEIESSLENLKKYQSGEKKTCMPHYEDRMHERIKDAELDKTHEEEVYSKFLRLKERFIQDYIKLADSVTTYQRYLEVRLNRIQYAAIIASGAIRPEEIVALNNKTLIILEENERKLDTLLSD